MFRYTGFLGQLLNEIQELIYKNDYNAVVWLGDHMGFPIIYKCLLECGITDIKIFDNNPKVQQKRYHPWLDDSGTGICVQPMQVENENIDHTLFLLSNTHYNEFYAILEPYGIKNKDVVDLLSLERRWMWESEADTVKKMKAISGRELQLVCLDALKYFKRFCKKQGLRYYLAEGSLIGAIRHKGFIPWDDDIDVFMPYEDYCTMSRVFLDDDRYQLLEWHREDYYPIQFAKLVDKRTYLLHPDLFGYSVMGCGIDIFPLGGYPSEQERIMSKWQCNTQLDGLFKSFCATRGIKGYEYRDCRQEIVDEKYGLPFELAKHIGVMQLINFKPWVAEKKWFEETIEIRFEDDVFCAPKEYNAYLRIRYGDYMRLPPENERKTHPYPSYYNG